MFQGLDWIRIQHQVGSGSGFSEYGSGTLVIPNQAVVDLVEPDAKDLDQYRM
jgi:hypothetical protein